MTASGPATSIEHLLRELAPQVLGAVMRRFDDFAASEDAVQEALVAASVQWPRDGLPDQPRAWLVRVASRRMADHLRSDAARRKREAAVLAEMEPNVPAADSPQASDPGDDSLVLLFMCCHEALTAPSAIALTLRAVGGLTTAEIAHAFMVPEATMAQRISRAKQSVRASGIPFRMPADDDHDRRLTAVLHTLYLIFNEGYTSSAGPELLRADLTAEAIRLARAVRARLPEDGEVAGLLALMLLTDARRRARTGSAGELVPLAEQDRTLWDRAAIEEGIALITQALSHGRVGPYQLQAAIAAVHDEAQRVEDTDWTQILALYGLLERMSDNPLITLNRAIALAMVKGPAAGIDMLDSIGDDRRLHEYHRLDAVRAHLLERAGRTTEAIENYLRAAGGTTNLAERNYLLTQAARLRDAK